MNERTKSRVEYDNKLTAKILKKTEKVSQNAYEGCINYVCF